MYSSKLNEFIQKYNNNNNIKTEYEYETVKINNIDRFKCIFKCNEKTFVTTEHYENKRKAKNEVSKKALEELQKCQNVFKNSTTSKNENETDLEKYLGRFYELNNIDSKYVKLLNIKPIPNVNKYIIHFEYNEFIYISNEPKTFNEIEKTLDNCYKLYINRLNTKDKRKEIEIENIILTSKFEKIDNNLTKYEILLNGIAIESLYEKENFLKQNEIKIKKETLGKIIMGKKYSELELNPNIQIIDKSDMVNEDYQLNIIDNYYKKCTKYLQYLDNMLNSQKEKYQKINISILINEILTNLSNTENKNNLYNFEINEIHENEIHNIINYTKVLFIRVNCNLEKKIVNKIFIEILKKLEGKYIYYKINIEKYYLYIEFLSRNNIKIYIGKKLNMTILKKYIEPYNQWITNMYEKKFIIFVNLLSNLYFHKNIQTGSRYLTIQEKENIFNVLALYSIKKMKQQIILENKKKEKEKYKIIYLLLDFLNSLKNYKKLRMSCEKELKEEMNRPYIIDPVTNRNLIRNDNIQYWESFGKYASYLLDNFNMKDNGLIDIRLENENDYLKFSEINYCISIEKNQEIISSKYHIPEEISEKLKYYNYNYNIFQSFLSYLILKINEVLYIMKNNNNNLQGNSNETIDTKEDNNDFLVKEIKKEIKYFFERINKKEEYNCLTEYSYFKINEISEIQFKLKENKEKYITMKIPYEDSLILIIKIDIII